MPWEQDIKKNGQFSLIMSSGKPGW